MSQIPQSFSKIGVIVGRDQVGDALIKLPFLRGLRNAFPAAEIHWITSHGPTAFSDILREPARPFIDQIDVCPAWLPTKRNPVAESGAPFFDLLLDTRNRWREALLAKKVPHRLFIATAWRGLLSHRRTPVWRGKLPHMVDRLLQMVELAAGFMPPSTGALQIPPQLKSAARKILPEGKTYVGLATGAGYAIKIWPRWKFEKLAALQETKGRVPVFLLGPQERADYEALAAALPAAKFPLQEKEVWGGAPLGIDHTLAIASLLDAAVANDSGVGHMLAAADCPLVSLFGPTAPEKLAPRVSRGTVIRAQDFGSAQMDAIPLEAVDAALDELLRPS